jgi:TadE-like protein
MRARRLRTGRSSIGIARVLAARARCASEEGRSDAAGVAQRGAATVEFAMALPLLAVFTIALCGVILLTRDAVLAQGAAREGARAAAVSGDRSDAVAAARATLPAGRNAEVSIGRAGHDRILVQVSLPVPLPYVRPLAVTAEAVAAVEPDPGPGTTNPRADR